MHSLTIGGNMLTKQSIITLLQTDARAVARALIVLTERQTTDERNSEQTRHLNGRGFRPCHARMGTNMANFFKRQGYLTDRQVAYWRQTDRTGAMRIGIYAGQLLEEAMLKQKTKSQIVIDHATLTGMPLNVIGMSKPAIDAEIKRLEYEVGMVMDSDDEGMIGSAQKELDDFMAKVRNNGR